jgi:hypothetical protein
MRLFRVLSEFPIFLKRLYTHLHDQLHPPFGERCEISNSPRASNLAWLPPTVHSNCSEWLWLHARTFFGCPGESPWLARRIIFFRRRTLPLLPLNYASVVAAKTRIQRCLCNCRWNLAIPYGWKPHGIWQRSRYYGGRPIANSSGFLQPSIRLRYNYCVQLVAVRRDWMRVANLKSRSARQRGGWVYALRKYYENQN